MRQLQLARHINMSPWWWLLYMAASFREADGGGGWRRAPHGFAELLFWEPVCSLCCAACSPRARRSGEVFPGLSEHSRSPARVRYVSGVGRSLFPKGNPSKQS